MSRFALAAVAGRCRIVDGCGHAVGSRGCRMGGRNRDVGGWAGTWAARTEMWAVVAAPWAWSAIWAAGAFAYPWAAETTMWTAAGRVGIAAAATETAAVAILRLICVGVREVGECRRCWWNFYNVTIFQMTISNDLGKLSKQTIHYWAKESIHRGRNQTIRLSIIRSRKTITHAHLPSFFT